MQLYCKSRKRDFPGGPVVKNQPANVGDSDLIPPLGRSYIHGVTKPVATTTEPASHNYWSLHVYSPCSTRREVTAIRGPHLLQLEEAHEQQWRPSTAPKKISQRSSVLSLERTLLKWDPHSSCLPPAFLFLRTQTCSVDPALLGRTSLRLLFPLLLEKGNISRPSAIITMLSGALLHNPLVRTECWASRQLWCDQQDGRSNTAQPQCCLKYPKVMGTLYLLTPSGSGSLETEWEQISMGGRVWNRKWYFTLFLSQLEKQKQTGPGNITNKWDKYSHRVKEAARLWEPGQSITHAASEGPWLSTMSWV